MGIGYSIPNNGHVELTIFNIFGQSINKLVDKYQKAGRYEVKWSGIDEFGNNIASGIYYYKILAGEYVDSKKLLLINRA